jgi:hypothetical protein
VSGVECGVCLRSYSPSTWRSLPLVRTLGPRELEAIIVRWRAERVIEVRRCGSCGHELARAATAG